MDMRTFFVYPSNGRVNMWLRWVSVVCVIDHSQKGFFIKQTMQGYFFRRPCNKLSVVLHGVSKVSFTL